MMSKYASSFTIIALVIIFGVIYTSCEKKVGKLPVKTTVSANVCDSATYALKIKKIIETSCAITDCHVSGFGSGDFTQFDALKLKVDAGSFKTRVFDSPANPMPPVSNGGKLSSDKLELIKCWLDKGAKNE